MLGLGRVCHIQAKDVDSGENQFSQLVGFPARRTDGSDDFGTGTVERVGSQHWSHIDCSLMTFDSTIALLPFTAGPAQDDCIGPAWEQRKERIQDARRKGNYNFGITPLAPNEDPIR